MADQGLSLLLQCLQMFKVSNLFDLRKVDVDVCNLVRNPLPMPVAVVLRPFPADLDEASSSLVCETFDHL